MMSSQSHIRFSIPADTCPELELFAVGLMQALTNDAIDCEITHYAYENSGVISGRSRSVDGSELEFSIHAHDRQSLAALALDGQEVAMLALVIQAGLVERTGSGGNALRVLFSGVQEFDRRMKMTARTITELRRRRRPAVFMAVGELPEAMIRLAPPDHHFPRIDGMELQELLGGCDVVLECVDADEPRTALSCLAESAGIPVVVHRTAAGTQVVRTDEWSADGFCDALTLPDLALIDWNGRVFENTYSNFKGALGFAQD